MPECTQSGTILTIKNYGIKKLKVATKGDMFVRIVVEVPKSLNKEQKELLKKFDAASDPKKQYPIKKPTKRNFHKQNTRAEAYKGTPDEI